MTGLERFDLYLKKKMNTLNMNLRVTSGSLDFDNQEEYDFLTREKLLLQDIIHHFELFVKGENDV